VTIPLSMIGGRETEAPIVGVSHGLAFMVEEAKEFAARNVPTSSKVHVTYDGKTMLMSYDLYGWHPLRRDERVCVVGISDRHYLAEQAAEEAWFQFNTNVFLAELVRTRSTPLELLEAGRCDEAVAA
jgi:hypothetical protein